MKPPAFRYERPSTVEEAVALLAEYGDEAKPLAGGQSLIPAMNFRLARPSVLVDLGAIHELDFITLEGDEVRVGAMTRQSAVERSALVREHVPLVSGALPHVAHFQIRNRGTFGGNLAHADPSSELPAVLLALNGRCRIVGCGVSRWVTADEFFLDLFATACCDTELLVEVALPVQGSCEGWGFHEFARRHGDYALAGAAAWVRVEAGCCTQARIALHSVSETPVLAAEASELLLGVDLSNPQSLDDVIHSVAHAVRSALDPPGDLQATPEYRLHLAEVLTRRALNDACSRALAALPEGDVLD